LCAFTRHSDAVAPPSDVSSSGGFFLCPSSFLFGRNAHCSLEFVQRRLFLKEWAERWPDARLFAPPGLAKKKPELQYRV
jgi:hypothetical protein